MVNKKTLFQKNCEKKNFFFKGRDLSKYKNLEHGNVATGDGGEKIVGHPSKQFEQKSTYELYEKKKSKHKKRFEVRIRAK